MDEVKHQYKVMFHRAAREATKLVKINVMTDVGPDPLDEKPLQTFAKEGGKAQVSEVIF